MSENFEQRVQKIQNDLKNLAKAQEICNKIWDKINQDIKEFNAKIDDLSIRKEVYESSESVSE